MTTYNQQDIDDVLKEFKRTKSPFKASKATGLPTKDVWAIIQANQDTLGSIQTNFDGNGRPDIQKFFVASRRASEGQWDNSDPAIVKARADYEAGTHEMATHRDGPWLFLCSFPLKRAVAERPGYFTPESC